MPLTTLDGRYIVVRGSLWRASDPRLPKAERQAAVTALMSARRAVRAARGDSEALAAAGAEVDRAKRLLGERGTVWWDDGSPDLNGHKAATTHYAEWYAGVAANDVP